MKKIQTKSKSFALAAAFMALTIIAGCKKYVDFHDVVLITGTETSNLVKFTVEGIPSTYGLTATVTGKVTENTTISFQVDTTLVAAYNAANSANFSPAPEGSYQLSSTSSLIKAGTNVSEPINVKIVSLDEFIDGRSYIIPVTIVNVSGGNQVLEASRTIYLKIARVIDFKAIDISNPSFYYNNVFEEPYNNVTQFTYEIKCYLKSITGGIMRLSNWGPTDNGTLPNLLRFGEAGSQPNQLQWVSGGGSVFSQTLFATNTWYTISCTFDGSTYKMYVNGKLDASFAGSPKTYQFGSLQFGYEFSQLFPGNIAEVRFWDKSLSLSEIQEGICGVDATSKGLVAYWKMNEGSGQTFFDRTGNGRDMVWPDTVVWVSDDINNKCAQ